MKILVLGSNGMVGHLLSIYFKEQGHQVTGFAKAESRFIDTIIGDATDTALVSSIVCGQKYDAVINCIGILNQFAESNKSKAIYLNSYFPHFLATITKKTNTQIVHISTDCVFSGNKGQYSENDFRDGLTFYDRTKALGEIEDDRNITLRQSIIGPDTKKNGIGLLNWFMQQKGDVTGYARAIWTGQTTLQLAKTIEEAIKIKACGLYNMVPETSISKYDLLLLLNKYLRKDKVIIVPVDNVVVDKSLRRTRFGFYYRIPEYEQMIIELADWMKAHRSLYPHYEF